MKLKEGVKLAGLTPQMVLAATIINDCFWNISVDCVITSANDSRHSATSLHYSGRALDIRTNTVRRSRIEELVLDIKISLGKEFDVVLEDKNTPNEHLHVEWDPK